MRIVYKSGRIRLTGADIAELRRECWQRDGGCCQECLGRTFYVPFYPGHPQGYEMAHIKSRGAGGSDTLENVRCLCRRCHDLEHRGKIARPSLA